MANDILIKIRIDSKGNLLDHSAEQMKKLNEETRRNTRRQKKNTEEVKKAEKAQKKYNRTRDQYNRKEKGAAQMGMNSTKSFSKMQQNIDGGGGGGGLVRAYALLAANVFALTAAFGVLSRAAQIDTLKESMEVLTMTGGTNIRNLSNEMKAAAGGAIALDQAFRQVSLAASAGLSTAEIEGLTTVAKGAAISLGRNLPDAMDRIFRGAIKLEPEILDEIGLFVRVDEAAQKYGRSIGKTVSSMTQAEKRQAFLNEILEQGSRKFSIYADTIKPDPYVRLGSALSDIAQLGLSKLNVVLGALAEFLANSPVVLGAAFGLLVTVLLSKAIPALGMFNKGLEEQAVQAAMTADIHRSKFANMYNDLKQQRIDDLQDTINKGREKRAALQEGIVPFKSRAAGADKNLENILKTRKAETKRAAVAERITILTKAEGRAKGKNLDIIKEELAARNKQLASLDQEIKLQKQITREENKRIPAFKARTAAAREAVRLENKAASASAVSFATLTAESQGVRQGFGALFSTLRAGQVTIDGTTFKMTAMGRVMTGLKGTASLLAVAMGNLFAKLMKFVMILTLAMPIIKRGMKALGFFSVEAEELGKELEKLENINLNLAKNFAKQAEIMNDTSNGYLAVTKAAQAMSTAQLEASLTAIAVGDATMAFSTFGTDIAKFGDLMLDIFGRSKLVNSFAETVQASMQKAVGYIRVGNREMARVILEGLESETLIGDMNPKQLANTRATAPDTIALFGDMITGDDLNSFLNETIALTDTLRENQEAANTALNKSSVIQGIYTTALAKGITFTEQMTITNDRYTASALGLSKAEAEVLDLMTETNAKFEEKIKKLNDATDSQEDLVAKLNQNLAQEEKMKKQLDVLVSAYEGASEAVGKFTAAFLPKTKVDEVTASLQQNLGAVLQATEAQRNFFFETFDKNPFSLIATPAEVARIQKGGKDATLAFSELVEVFVKAQKEILAYRALIKASQEEQKHFTKIILKSVEAQEHINELKADELAKTTALSLLEFNTFNRNMQLEEEELRNLAVKVKGAQTLAEFQALALANGTSEKELFQLLASFEALRTQEIKERIFEFQKEFLVQKETLKVYQAQVKVAKQIAEQANKAAEAAQVRFNLEKGLSGELTKGQQAVNEVKQAETSYRFAILEAGIKAKTMELEYKLLDAKLRALVKEGVIEEAEKDDMLSAQESVNKLTTQLIKEQMSLLEDTFAGALGNGVAKAFTGATMREGIFASAQMFAESLLVKTGETDVDKDGNAVTATTDRKVTEEQKSRIVIMQSLRGAMTNLIETSKQFGPEGVFVSNFLTGFQALGDGLKTVMVSFTDIDTVAAEHLEKTGVAVDTSMAKRAAVMEGVASGFAALGQMMSAVSDLRIREVDQEIAAEKRKDGKSKESLAKIAAMEKKKEAMAKKAFEQQKKVQMAVTVANTAAAIIGALAPRPMGYGPTPIGFAMAGIAAAAGALQLAVISRQKYSGGQSEAPPAPTQLSIGARNNTVDVSRGATGGEIGYLRGQRGVGSNANNFTPTGAMGLKSYNTGGEGILVGEQGPEIVRPTVPVDVIPNDNIGGGVSNVNFTINAVDATGVQQLLMEQRGNIIGMIREAAHDTGNDFLEDVDTQALGGTGAY